MTKLLYYLTEKNTTYGSLLLIKLPKVFNLAKVSALSPNYTQIYYVI